MKKWIAVIFCLLLFPWLIDAAEYYRWTDENGVSHITDQPPAQPKKNVKTYRFKTQTQPMAPASQVIGETPGGVMEGQTEGGQPSDYQQGQDLNLELEKARQEYEEAKSHESEYRRNYNESYGYGKDRQHWREKLQDIESKKQKLDSLESGGSGGDSSPSTESSATIEDGTPK